MLPSKLTNSQAQEDILEIENEAIYGEDDRKEVYDPANRLVDVYAAQASAALFHTKNLSLDPCDPAITHLPKRSMEEHYGTCQDEPFSQQPISAICSGFLVADDLLVTAGHCMQLADSCAGTSFVFDYSYDSLSRDATAVRTADIYGCKAVTAYELQGQRDYAVVQLDRKVSNRTPLKLRRHGKIELGTPLVVIGNPTGLPTKITGGGAVRSNDLEAAFMANLDTYEGSSGSAVLNANTGEVEGILIDGEKDFEEGPVDSCLQSKRCTNDACRGEAVSRTALFSAFIPEL